MCTVVFNGSDKYLFSIRLNVLKIVAYIAGCLKMYSIVMGREGEIRMKYLQGMHKYLFFWKML